MIVLDENIPAGQCALLRRWRIRFRQIGQDVGQGGMQDEAIIPLLMRIGRVTFLTRDADFFDRRLCHSRYSLVCLAIEREEVASFIRRILRNSLLKTQTLRNGAVVRVSHLGLTIWRKSFHRPASHRWSDNGGESK